MRPALYLVLIAVVAVLAVGAASLGGSSAASTSAPVARGHAVGWDGAKIVRRGEFGWQQQCPANNPAATTPAR